MLFRPQTHKHCLHSGEPHLNTLTDLVISLGTSLQSHQTQTYLLVHKLKLKIEQQYHTFEELKRNLDYLKETQNINQKNQSINIDSNLLL